ncbi:DUF2569 family protein [Bacteroides acidifaciens]|uniref:DUF2569 family protein n=1 Tax=Bacteroides acidifaciens TaxID=85831 RepID=UPI00242C5AEB|nr:DUF2569 family protein [Bacteroides acidifaciens]
MAIKDQCEQCKKYNDSCTGNIEFNGQSCDLYVKRINLEKAEKEVNQDTTNINQTQIPNPQIDYPDPNEHIHGWLGFLLFSMGLGGLFSAIYPIFTYNVEEYGSHFLALTDVFFGVMLLALAIYSIYAFLKKKPNAVYLTKVYIIAVFVSNIIVLLSGEFEETGIGSMPRLIRSLIWSIIWFLYLNFSEQVKNIIPKSYRKLFSRDYYITAAFVIVPLFMLGIGIADIQSQHDKIEAQFISSTDLAYNEYTDGRIVFTKPDGFTCEKQEIDDPKIILFDLELSDCAWIRICSDYDSDITAKNFNSYWENWKDSELEEYSYKEILNEKRSINGNPYFIKTIQYETENPIKWHYALLFNTQTGKVCLLSYYQFGNSENYLEVILKSIRF